MATNYRGLFGGGPSRRRRGVGIEDVRGTYNPIFGGGVAGAARAAQNRARATDTSITRAVRSVGESARRDTAGGTQRVDVSGVGRAATQAAQAIRRQVARSGGQARSAPTATPRGAPAHRTLPNPVPGSTGTGGTGARYSAPAAPSGGPAQSAPRTPPQPAAGPPRLEMGTKNRLVKRAQAANVDPGSFEKDTLNRAVNRFMATHKWARQAGAQSEAVRKAAAYLLSKEHKFYNAPAGKAPKRKKGEG